MELEEIRKKIDLLDEEMVRTLAKRMALVKEVARFKKEKGLPFKQPEREQQLIEEKRKLAQELGLDPGFVENLCKAIIDQSLKLEEKA